MAEASYPEDLKYHAEHDWARVDGDSATLGITWFAQDQLGEVVYFDPPAVGTTLTKDAPEKVNDDPYGDGWLVRVRLTEPSEVEALLDVETYRSRLAAEASE